MKNQKHIVGSEFKGKRLDQFLASKNLTRSMALKIIKSGNIKVDDKVIIKPAFLLKENQSVSVLIPEIKKIEILPLDLKIPILFEDEHLAVVEKPSGISVHPSQTENAPTLVHGLLHSLKSLSSIGGVERPGIVHRIDKGTSGILLISKSDLVHQHLSTQFKEHTITRRYLALVLGNISEKGQKGKIETFYGRNPKHRKKMTGKIKSNRIALTHWKLVRTFLGGKISLIECDLKTGRTHQIRVHMSEFGFPILGDSLYGNAKSAQRILGKMNLSHQLLHAYYLQFEHPVTKKTLEFSSDLPADFQKVIQILESYS